MRNDKSCAQVLTAFILISVCLLLPRSISANWGIEVRRATESDQVRLLSDWTAMKMARTRIDRAIGNPLGKERQRQLLGLGPDRSVSSAELLDSVYDYWIKEVMTPAQLIAMNPAASCEEATLAVSTLLGMMRQRQLLGIEDSDQRAAELLRVLEASGEMVMQRCREEALDECVATGRFRQIIELAFVERRNQALLGRNADSLDWADDALEQCAIYDLKFVSTTKVVQPHFETVREGLITIKYDRSAGSLEQAIAPGKLGDFFNGKTEGGANPSFVSITCPQMPQVQVTCRPTANDPVRARLDSMDLRHREFHFKDGVSSVSMAGNDEFKLELAGGIYEIHAVIKVPYGNDVEMPFPAFGASFYIAHKKDQTGEGAAQGKGIAVKIDRIARGAYPVIFQFTYADQNIVGQAQVSDSTEIRLIHRPEPKPFGPRPEQPGDKIRKPLKPRPGGNL